MLTWCEERKRFEFSYISSEITSLQIFRGVFFPTYVNLKAAKFNDDTINNVIYTTDKNCAVWFCVLEAMTKGGIVTQECVMKLIEQIFGVNPDDIDKLSKPKTGRNIIIRK